MAGVCFGIGFYYIAQLGPKLITLLSYPPKYGIIGIYHHIRLKP